MRALASLPPVVLLFVVIALVASGQSLGNASALASPEAPTVLQWTVRADHPASQPRMPPP